MLPESRQVLVSATHQDRARLDLPQAGVSSPGGDEVVEVGLLDSVYPPAANLIPQG